MLSHHPPWLLCVCRALLPSNAKFGGSQTIDTILSLTLLQRMHYSDAILFFPSTRACLKTIGANFFSQPKMTSGFQGRKIRTLVGRHQLRLRLPRQKAKGHRRGTGNKSGTRMKKRLHARLEMSRAKLWPRGIPRGACALDFCLNRCEGKYNAATCTHCFVIY